MSGALPGDTELDRSSRAVLCGCVASDIALRTALASVISGALLRSLLSSRGREEAGDLAFYAELAEARDASAVFVAPGDAQITATRAAQRSLPGGRVEQLQFESDYEAVNPRVRRAYGAHESNRIGVAQHWRHDDRPRETLCVIHGFGASPAWFNAMFFSCTRFRSTEGGEARRSR
jgi:hypothetical protein